MKRDDARHAERTHPKRRELGLVDALAQLSFAVQGALAQIAAEHALSLIQTRLLGVLRDRTPGMNELARYLEVDKSSITGLVDRAETRGLVRRRPSSTDGRGIAVSITPAGRKLVQQIVSDFETRIAALVAPLDAAERKALSELASRIVVTYAAERGVDAAAGGDVGASEASWPRR